MDGEQHTVPRAEALAVCVVLEAVARDRDVELFVDNDDTVKKLRRYIDDPWAPRSMAKNFDLWNRVRQALQQRQGKACTTVKWVKSHADANVDFIWRFELLEHEVVGNKAADVLAGMGAKEARVGPGDRERHLWQEAALRAVQRRLLSIHREALFNSSGQRPRAFGPHPLPPVPQTVAALAIASSHDLVSSSAARAGVWCKRCQQVPERAELQQWLKQPCREAVPPAKLDSCWASVEGLVVVVGGRRLHESHRLHVCRGLYFCVRCGYYSGEAPRNLAEPCAGVLSPAGAGNLSRIRRQLLPIRLRAWPGARAVGRRAIVLA